MQSQAMGAKKPTHGRTFQCQSHRILLDAANKSLLKDGVTIELPLKTFNVLHRIISAGQDVISREELIDTVWQGNHFVGQKAVNQAIWQLRKALGDSIENPVFIETIPKVGYRWLGKELDHEQPYKAGHAKQFSLKRLSVLTVVTLLLFSVAVYQLNTNSKVQVTNLPRLEQIYASNQPGVERAVSFSFDKHFIAYEKVDPRGVSRILLSTFTADNTREQLVVSPISELNSNINQVSPVFSPTTMVLAYIKKNQLQTCEVLLYNLNSQEETHVDYCSVTWLTQVRWSPDGSMLAYSYSDATRGTTGIRLFELSTGITRELTAKTGVGFFSDSVLSWSRHKQAITVISAVNPARFTISNVTIDGIETVLFESTKPLMGATWYQDKLIYAVQNQIGTNQLKSFAAKTQSHQIIGDIFAGSWFPSSDANEQYLALSALTEYHYIGLQHGHQSSTIRSLGDNRNLQFSSNGQYSVVESNRSGKSQLYLKANHSKELKRLNIELEGIQYPRWSPDSSKLVFNARNESAATNGLYLYNLQTKHITRVGDLNVSYGPATWTEQGKHLIVANDKDDLWRLVKLELSTGKEELLTQHMSIFGFYKEDKDILIYVRPNTSGIWKTAPTSSTHHTTFSLIVETPRAISHFVAWEVIGDALFVTNKDAITRYLWQEPSPPQQLYKFGGDTSIDPYSFISVDKNGGISATLMPPPEEDLFIYKWLEK